MGQDTAKSTEWVYGEDWLDCTDTQVDEHLHLFFAYNFNKFYAFQSNNCTTQRKTTETESWISWSAL